MKNSLIILLFLATACVAEPKETKSKQETTKAPKRSGKFQQAEKIFFPDGKIQCAGELVNGKRQGMWTSWYNSGAMNSAVNFVNDAMDGEYTVWFESGQVRIHGWYKKDKEVGTWHFMNEQGDTIKQIDFDKNS